MAGVPGAGVSGGSHSVVSPDAGRGHRDEDRGVEPSASSARPLLIRRPWERRRFVLAASAVLFAAVFALRQGSGEVESGLALLYVFPVILIALELGIVAGFGAAMLATALVIVWATTAPVDLGIVGIVTRAAVFLAAGLVAGRFSDHMRRVFASQDRLLGAGLELARLGDAGRLAAMVLDRVCELPGVRGARLTIGGRPAGERGALGERRERFALSSRGARRGVLEVELRGGAEERAAIAMLALQASVALENQSLLESERERVRLQAALGDAEQRLGERGDALRTVLDGQELERREVAQELHEGAAQALAGVLFGLEVVQSDVESDRSIKRLADARHHVDTTLASLRELATALRPAVLDDLGLGPALERLVERASAEGLERFDVELGSTGGRLGPELEAGVYRAVEEALRISPGAEAASIRYDEPASRLRISVRRRPAGTPGDPAALRARVELLGGRVSAGGDSIIATIPLGRAAAAGAPTAAANGR